MNLKLITIYSILLIANVLTAQDNQEADRLIMSANNALQMGDSETYIKRINEALSKFSDYPPIYMAYTKYNMDRRDYAKALELQQKLYSLNPKFNPLQHKLLAECYFNTGDLDNADIHAKKFLELPGLSPVNYNECKRMLRNIKFIKSNPPSAKIQFENLGANINSKYEEYFPSTDADERFLYFTRNTNMQEDIFVSEKVNGTYAPAKPIDLPDMNEDGTFQSINSTHNDGAHTISPDGRYLFFTSCGRPKGYNSCDIYFASRVGGLWGKPKILPKPVNSISWESQPCITNDGSRLYFVSGRPGGLGGIDIYYCNISSSGEFSEPINIGAPINTEYDEDKPFIHPDGQTLYFSSNGHPGYGGKDLFMSKLVDGQWTNPVNLGNQINTIGDEVSIFVNALGTKAYLSRPSDGGTGRKNLDIFSFDLPENIKPSLVTYLKGIVLNKSTRQPLKANIKINDALANKNITTTSSDARNGEFLVPLAVQSNLYSFWVNKEGFALYSQAFEFDTKSQKPQEVVIELVPLTSGSKFELRNVFFATGKYELKPESKTELDMVVKMLKSNPSIQIQISGHTDNVGQEASNKLLSQNRAKSVLEYLVSEGIESTRLTSQGYGSSQPIAPNDTPEGRAKNRRTEIEIK